jgi:branched-chain amino acid transport system ATP-binding protein
MAALLELAALSRGFGALKVIDNLNFQVDDGDILGVLGPNGAGKTTLFNVIAGVLPPTGGRVLFQGRDITRLKPWTRYRLGIGRTYQIPKPFTHMSVFENVLVAAVNGGGLRRGGAKARAAQVLALTGLGRWAEMPAGQLSLLNLKRLELAKALACRPRLLLLDEIAGGLTDAECDTLLEVVRAVHGQGTTIVWIEHVIHALRRIATGLAVLHGGSFIAAGRPDDVLADRRVKEVYLGIEE